MTSLMPVQKREDYKEQMKGLNELEAKPDAEQNEAGVNKLPRFGIVKRISNLIEETLNKNKVRK